MSILPHPTPLPSTTNPQPLSPQIQPFQHPQFTAPARSLASDWNGFLPPHHLWRGAGAWSHQVPKTPDFFFPILDSSPCPQHLLEAATGRGGPHSRAGLHVPGWGGTSALTSSSQPRGWTELDRVKGALSPSPGLTALRFPRSACVGGLWPLPAQPLAVMLSPPGPPAEPGGEQLVHRGPGFSGLLLPARQDIVTFNAETSTPQASSGTSFRSRPPEPSAQIAPRPREARSQVMGGGGKWGSGEVAGRRPLPCFSFAMRVSLPKSLEKFLSLPASQPLKAGEAGEPAAASCSCLRLQYPIQPTPQVLLLYPCGSFNVPGSRVSSFLTRASGPEFTTLPQCSPLPTSHHRRSPPPPSGQSQSPPPRRPQPTRAVRAHLKNLADHPPLPPKKSGRPTTREFTGARSSGLRTPGAGTGRGGPASPRPSPPPPPL